jgi:hypothetical protein
MFIIMPMGRCHVGNYTSQSQLNLFAGRRTKDGAPSKQELDKIIAILHISQKVFLLRKGVSRYQNLIGDAYQYQYQYPS